MSSDVGRSGCKNSTAMNGVDPVVPGFDMQIIAK